MSHMRLIFAVLLLTAIVGIVPQAYATTKVEVVIVGASAEWQTLGLAAYHLAGSGAGHWTSASNTINVTDTRVSPVNVDAGTLWVVWNSAATEVWAFAKVDSIVGTRCFFAQPACSVSGTSTALSGSGSNQIPSTFWGTDSALPANVEALFTAGQITTVAATFERPEDAQFLTCRVNSILGAGSYGGSASDGLDGLGYNSVNAPGVCPGSGLAFGAYVGTPVKSGYPGSTGAANVLAFNIKGTDPISGTTIPAYTVLEVGAAPLVFITERDKGQLTDLTNASPEQLQQVFSGTNCDANAFGLPTGKINIFLNEGISGQGNVAEAAVFRHPTVYTGSGSGAVLGLSQEANVGSNNPLAGQSGTCLSGTGARYRAIGSSEETKAVQNSSAKFGGTDGIGYGIFSYSNFSAIANSPTYGYITLNNVDPIFTTYGPQSSTGLGYDPGQPAVAGTLPATANLPTACSGAFPCAENQIWAGGLSFPNLRNGTYPAWSLLRLIAGSTALTNAKNLVKEAQEYAVTSVPDFVPFVKTTAGGITDPGLTLVRSHYQQYDGGGNLIGAAPVNSGTKESGGDFGGQVLSPATATTTQQVQGNQGLQVRP
ncbi:MAG: hypothetical protein WBS24_19190 [Terriglobales bacterium]